MDFARAAGGALGLFGRARATGEVGAAGAVAAHRRLGGLRLGRFAVRRRRIALEIDAGLVGEALAELVAQHPGLDRLDGADRQVAELERAVADADQAVDLEAERAEDVLDLAVLAFAQRHQQPDVVALLALERGFDRAVLDALDLDAVLELVELRPG